MISVSGLFGALRWTDACFQKVNPEYISVNWDASGGGAFAVIPLNERGKLPDQIPLFRGHTATVLDTDWFVVRFQLIYIKATHQKTRKQQMVVAIGCWFGC